MLMRNNRLNVRISPGAIGHPDLVFILYELPTVPFLDSSILILPFSDLINEYRVSLGNLDLLFETLLFILEPAEVIFDHLSLNLFLLQIESLLELAGASQPCHFVYRRRGMLQAIGQDIAEAVLVASKLLGCDLSLADDTVLAVEEPVLKATRLSHTCILRWTSLLSDVWQILLFLAIAHCGTHYAD